MRRILLLEPVDVTLSHLPMGLMKIATFHKELGDDVTYAKGVNEEIAKRPFDKIYVTSLFTFWVEDTIRTIKYYRQFNPDAEIEIGGISASLIPNVFKEHLGVTPHFGLDDRFEHLRPSYEYFPEANYSLTMTSRGCVNKCGFCAVHKMEPVYKLRKEWWLDLATDHEAIWLYDNNWLAKPAKDIIEDAEKLKELLQSTDNQFQWVDFNQGLDARLWRKEVVQHFKGIRFEPLRFAFDNMSQDGHLQNAILLARDLGIVFTQDWYTTDRTLIYTLYNWKDTPEDFYYRIKEIVHVGGTPFPMRFQPLDVIKKGTYVGKHWTRLMRNNVTALCDFHGIVFAKSKEHFEETWGKDAKDFVRLLKFKNLQEYLNLKRRAPTIRKQKELVDSILDNTYVPYTKNPTKPAGTQKQHKLWKPKK